MSTNFFVTQAQRDLAQAEVNELRAIADYRKSVINYQRVQEAGVSGTGAALVLSGGSSSAAGRTSHSLGRGGIVGEPVLAAEPASGHPGGGRSPPSVFVYASLYRHLSRTVQPTRRDPV